MRHNLLETSIRQPALVPSRTHYDTVVVGAGPAGTLAALHAAERGPVLLVDAKSLPRSKSCGGMLHERSLEVLSGYGRLPERIIASPRTVSFRYHDWDRNLRKPTDVSFLNVSRTGFDEWLLGLLPPEVEIVENVVLDWASEHAEGATATLRAGGATREITCDVLIGADGARSRVRASVTGKAPACYLAIQDFILLDEELPAHFDCIYMRDIGSDLVYSYLVPKADVAVLGSIFYPRPNNAQAMHDEVIAAVRGRVRALGRPIHRESAPALYIRSPDDIHSGMRRVLLAGEAGGFMSPSSGEGISYALRTGRAAGIAAAGEPARAQERYGELVAPIRSDIERRLKWLPLLESRAGKYMASFVPTPLVSMVTHGL